VACAVASASAAPSISQRSAHRPRPLSPKPSFAKTPLSHTVAAVSAVSSTAEPKVSIPSGPNVAAVSQPSAVQASSSCVVM
jgi:hypothetical protein